MNLLDLRKKYGNEVKCIRHLEKAKWNGRPVCAFCSSVNLTKRQTGKGRYHCNTCNKDFSVLHGTIFEGSKLPLNTWFLIVSLMLNAKSGVSAKEIERQVGITYKSAWYACSRIRSANIENNNLLKSIVDISLNLVAAKSAKDVLVSSRKKSKLELATENRRLHVSKERETKKQLEILRNYSNYTKPEWIHTQH